MKYQCDAVISDGGHYGSTVFIYDEEGDLAYSIDAPLAIIKQRARAIVDWLNSLDDEAQRLAFCGDCGHPILSVQWHEEGTRALNIETGRWEETDDAGYGEWLCGCGHPLSYEDLCRIGVFTEPESDAGQTWPIWTLSEGDIYEACRLRDSGFTGYKGLDLDEVARVFGKAVSNSLGEGYDWQLILRDAIEEVI